MSCFSLSLSLFSLFLRIIPTSFSHRKEEKALCARVVEAEECRDAAVQEALKNVEVMKNECNGIVGSFYFLLYSNFPFC